MGKHDALHPILEQCLFPTAGPLHCAVSGGADSSALLILASMTGQQVTAHHVDHGLRPHGSAERDRVQELAEKVKAGFNAVALSLEDGPNLEARARSARFEALPKEVLTGHTADDQAETIILHLLRGGGLDALAGMGDDRHPIIRLRRADTEFVCRSYGWEPIEDPTNNDPRFRRNRVRHEILPLMNDVAQRDITPLLNRTAKLVQTDRDLLDLLAEQVDATDAASLASAPVPLARRAIRSWLRREHPPDSASVDRVLQVALGKATGTEVAGGRSIRRTNGKLRIETFSKEPSESTESD
ncbi:MAG: tRNA lysidine(34) synthetase TilS [Actinomycetota bacterium]|nr:tRNA lysidine(34) synthetase TilS [Actinomycetota bacterium]MEC9474158.1 tRNA lysidine(34) synthetase TilS [Actinomycetota bacterium]MEE2680596.1 tRNA lysidine(34) synthetase TilS [Actinomycetota bacterium]